MSSTIPFITSDNNYRLAVPIDGVLYLFDTYWNSREGIWYFDLLKADETPISYGLKIVLGVNIGSRLADPFFNKYIIRAFDTTGDGVDAGYDDLGERVIVTITSLANFLPAGTVL